MNYYMNYLLGQAKKNVDTMMEEQHRYPGEKELYAYPHGMTLNELISEFSKIKDKYGGDIPVFFQTSSGSDIRATGLHWEGITQDDLWEYEPNANLPSWVAVRLDDLDD